jgi:hypothetical protein
MIMTWDGLCKCPLSNRGQLVRLGFCSFLDFFS